MDVGDWIGHAMLQMRDALLLDLFLLEGRLRIMEHVKGIILVLHHSSECSPSRAAAAGGVACHACVGAP